VKFIFKNSASQKKQLFCKLWFAGRLVGFANVLFVGWGFFFFVRGEKKQKKFPCITPTYPQSTNPIIPFM